MPAAVADAAGSRFELLLPFGCSGPSEAGTSLPMQWRYDEADGTLRVSGKPMMWSEADWHLDYRARTAAAEGCWITQPWSSSGAFPRPARPAFSRGFSPLTLPAPPPPLAP